MASVHKFNQAIAAVRGMPPATVEAYSRVLRRGGVLPETRRGGGSPFTPTMAGYMLAAIMRGSPIDAAEHAREIGDLVLHSVDQSTFDPMVDRPRNALGWANGITFAEAIGWLIERYIDGSITNYVREDKSIEVVVDRYWTMASLHWHPVGLLRDEWIASWREALNTEPPSRVDGTTLAMEIGFHTPLLHEAKISYGVDRDRNREAHRKFRELRQRGERLDVHGTESITHRTLMAISDIFR